MSAAIKVTGCDLQKLRSKRTVRRFMRALVTEIGMKAYGRPTVKRYGTLAALIAAAGIRLRWRAIVKRFGEGALHGISAVQLIYTSSITWHSGGDDDPRCFLDLFSCKEFEPDTAAKVAADWFGGTATVQAVVQRGGAT
jgi:S-adenosylmethionine/arginine decarboxylase-like enzyme